MLNQNWNKFTSKVVLTFSDNSTYELFGQDTIQKVDISKEMFSINNDALGVVSTNTFRVYINDKQGIFTKNNVNSLLYGKLVTGFKVEYFIKMDDELIFNKVGTFFMSDITFSNVNSPICNIGCIDVFGYILNQDVSNSMLITKDILLKDYLISLFNSCGISNNNIIIDENINSIVIKYSASFGNKVKDILNLLCKSFSIVVYVDNDGNINVNKLSTLVTKVSNIEIKSDSGLYKTTLGASLLNTYNGVALKWNRPIVYENESMLLIEKVTLKSGLNNLNNYKFNNEARLIGLKQVRISTELNGIEIDSVDCTQSLINLVVNNTTDVNANVNVEIFGDSLHENMIVNTKAANEELYVDKSKLKNYEIESRFIQTDEHAEQCLNASLKMLNCEDLYIDIVCKGNPLLSIGDTALLASTINNFENKCLINSVKMTLGTSYSCNLKLINSSGIG